MGNGAKVPNDGQVNLNLQTGGDLLNDITSTFQVAEVSRPRISVGKLCNAGMEVTLRKTQADVVALAVPWWALLRDSPTGHMLPSSSSKDQP